MKIIASFTANTCALRFYHSENVSTDNKFSTNLIFSKCIVVVEHFLMVLDLFLRT